VKPARRSLRLRGYDYSQAGAYFVTMVTQDRACLFGEVVDGEVRLSDAGQMVWVVWSELPAHYPGVDINMFIVMPNHVHGIVVLTGTGRVGAGPRACPIDWDTGQLLGNNIGQPQGVAPTMALQDVVHRFKTLTTKQYGDGVKHSGWPAFHGRLWQRNYYEHIVRDEGELNRIREYIANNPAQWELDRENPNTPLGTACRAPTRYEYLWKGKA